MALFQVYININQRFNCSWYRVRVVAFMAYWVNSMSRGKDPVARSLFFFGGVVFQWRVVKLPFLPHKGLLYFAILFYSFFFFKPPFPKILPRQQMTPSEHTLLQESVCCLIMLFCVNSENNTSLCSLQRPTKPTNTRKQDVLPGEFWVVVREHQKLLWSLSDLSHSHRTTKSPFSSDLRKRNRENQLLGRESDTEHPSL